VLAKEAASHEEVIDKFRNVVRERETEVAQLQDDLAMAVRENELLAGGASEDDEASDDDGGNEDDDSDDGTFGNLDLAEARGQGEEERGRGESDATTANKLVGDTPKAASVSPPTRTTTAKSGPRTAARTGPRTGGGRSRVSTTMKDSARTAELTSRVAGLQLERALLQSDVRGLGLKAQWLGEGVFGLAHGGVPSTVTTVFHATNVNERLALLLDACLTSPSHVGGAGTFGRRGAQQSINVCPGLLAAGETMRRAVSLFKVCDVQGLVSVSSMLHAGVHQTDMATRALAAALKDARGELSGEEAERHCDALTHAAAAVSEMFDSAMEHLDAEQAVELRPVMSARRLVTCLQQHRVRCLELRVLAGTALEILVSEFSFAW
jgi:hypothetical protein